MLSRCVYLLDFFNGQGRVEDVPLLPNAGDAECVVDSPVALQGQLKQRDMILIFRDICGDELDPLAVVSRNKLFARSGVKIAKDDQRAPLD